MTYGVGTQAELDQANQRINAFKEDLLRRGFRTVSVSFSDSKEESILDGQYGRLKDLRVTLQTNKRLEEDAPEVAGGIHASISDEQADREFEELYKNVITVVTGRPQEPPSACDTSLEDPPGWLPDELPGAVDVAVLRFVVLQVLLYLLFRFAGRVIVQSFDHRFVLAHANTNPRELPIKRSG